MYDYRPATLTSKTQLYDDLLSADDALTAGERDGIANMANVAALLNDFLPI
jgi:GAF domain-containing protein